MALITAVLNFPVLHKLGSIKRAVRFDESPSVIFYILLISGAVATFFVAVPTFRDLFRYAGDHPWYFRYIILYLVFFCLICIVTLVEMFL